MDSVTTMFLIMFFIILALVTVLSVIFFVAGRVLIPYLSAKLRGVTLFLMQRKDGGREFLTGGYSAGAMDTKKGTYFTDDVAVKPFYGVPLGIVGEGIGITIPTKFDRIVKKLRKLGIEDYNQMEDYEKELLLDLQKTKTVKGKNNDTMEMGFVTGLFEDISYIKNFFKYNFNPYVVQQKIAAEVTEATKKNKTDLHKLVLIGCIGVFIVLIGVYLLTSTFKCPDCNHMYQLGLQVCEATKSSGSEVVKQTSQSIIK